MELQGLKQAYLLFNEDYWLRKGQLDNLNSTIKEKKEKLTDIEEKIYLYRQVSKIYQLAAEYARQQAKKTMENLVSNALTIIFPGDLKFMIEMEEKGEKAEANFLVSSTYGGDREICNEPQEARGGGVVDIIALALRIALVETARPRLGGPLILDEPAKHVSQEYAQNVAQFLNMVVETFQRQVIMVTHNQYLAETGNCAYEIVMDAGQSKAISKFKPRPETVL